MRAYQCHQGRRRRPSPEGYQPPPDLGIIQLGRPNREPVCISRSPLHGPTVRKRPASGGRSPEVLDERTHRNPLLFLVFVG